MSFNRKLVEELLDMANGRAINGTASAHKRTAALRDIVIFESLLALDERTRPPTPAELVSEIHRLGLTGE